MSTSTDCITPNVRRFCRICGDVAVEWSSEPSGAACLACPECGHSVEPSTVEYSTLAEPRRPRQTLRRRMTATALEVAEELNGRQTTDDWSEKRATQVETLLVVLKAVQSRNPAQLRRLLEVA